MWNYQWWGHVWTDTAAVLYHSGNSMAQSINIHHHFQPKTEKVFVWTHHNSFLAADNLGVRIGQSVLVFVFALHLADNYTHFERLLKAHLFHQSRETWWNFWFSGVMHKFYYLVTQQSITEQNTTDTLVSMHATTSLSTVLLHLLAYRTYWKRPVL